MTRKVFTRLLGLFVLLLAFHTAVMEIVFRHMARHSAGETLSRIGQEALWSGVIALLVALPVAAWVSIGIMNRLQRIVAFARRIAEGDLSARLERSDSDELAAMESALNQTAERLGSSFAEIESGRQELAAMLGLHAGSGGGCDCGGPGALVEQRDAAHGRYAGSRRASFGAFNARSRPAGLHQGRARDRRSARRAAPARWRRDAFSR